MDNGIFGLAMYGALKRDETANNRYIETKKGLVTLEDLVKFYENFSKQPQDVAVKETEKKSEKRPMRPRKRKVKTSDA